MQISSSLKWSIPGVIVLGAILITASFLPFQTFFPSSAYYESRPNLANGATWIQEVGYFVSGSYVKLDVSVYGGDKKISAQLVNSDVANITEEVAIDGHGAFSLEIPENGVYGLQIRNLGISNPNDEQILIKSYYYFYNYISLIPGILLIAAGIISLVIKDVEIIQTETEEIKGETQAASEITSKFESLQSNLS